MEWISVKSQTEIPINTKILLGWKSSNVFRPNDDIGFGMWTGKHFRGMDTEQPFAEPDYWSKIDVLPQKNIQYRVASYDESSKQHQFKEFPIGTDRVEIWKVVLEWQDKYGNSWVEGFSGSVWNATYELFMDR